MCGRRVWSLHGHDVAIRPQIQKNCVSKVHVAAHSLPVKFRMFQTPFRQRLSGPACVCARTSCDDGRRNRQQQDSTASRAGEVDTKYVQTYRSIQLIYVGCFTTGAHRRLVRIAVWLLHSGHRHVDVHTPPK